MLVEIGMDNEDCPVCGGELTSTAREFDFTDENGEAEKIGYCEDCYPDLADYIPCLWLQRDVLIRLHTKRPSVLELLNAIEHPIPYGVVPIILDYYRLPVEYVYLDYLCPETWKNAVMRMSESLLCGLVESPTILRLDRKKGTHRIPNAAIQRSDENWNRWRNCLGTMTGAMLNPMEAWKDLRRYVEKQHETAGWRVLLDCAQWFVPYRPVMSRYGEIQSEIKKLEEHAEKIRATDEYKFAAWEPAAGTLRSYVSSSSSSSSLGSIIISEKKKRTAKRKVDCEHDDDSGGPAILKTKLNN